MSTGIALVYPLILSATTLSGDAAKLVQSNVTVVTKSSARERTIATQWVVIRRTVGFGIEWYLLTLDEVEKALQGNRPDAVLWNVLKLGAHQRVWPVQSAEMDGRMRDAQLVLEGERVIGLIEAQGETTRAMAPRMSTKPPSVAAIAPQSPPPPSPSAGPPSPARPSAAGAAPAASAAPTEAVATGVAPFKAAAYINAPRRTQPGKKIPLEIGLAETPAEGVEGGVLSMNFPADEPDIVLNIHIECAGFTCDKGFDHSLKIKVSDPFTSRLKLFLVATPLADGVDEELRALQFFYSYNGAACGSATYRILVQRTDIAITPPSVSSEKPSISITPTAPPIDVTFRIAWQDDNEATHTLRWSFTSPHAITEPAGKMSRSSTELASLPISIIDEVAQGDGVAGIELLMEGIGASITNEIPAGVWEVLANARKAVQDKRGVSAISTVLLLTQETRVPWELALVPDSISDTARAKFLNTQFIVTRWLLDDNIAAVPPFNAKAHDLIAVYGDYAASNVGELPFAKREAELLTSRHATTFSATRDNVLSVLLNKATQASGATLAPGVLHFAGHGEAARSNTAASFLMLNDGTTLSMTYFLNAPGLKANHPLVFLNACQVGAATTSLGQPGGFAGFCVRAGCSAVIAPLWSVNDEVAYTVAKEFYDDVLRDVGQTGISVAEAMFNARQKPYTDISETDAGGNVTTRTTATRLAYLVYAHPAFHL